MAKEKTIEEVIAQKWKTISTKMSKSIIAKPFSSKISWFSNEIAQFAVILLLFSTAFFTDEVIEFSQTLPGHLVAVGIILYFTAVSPMFGAMISMFIILFYNTDLVQAFLQDELVVRQINREYFSSSDSQRKKDGEKEMFNSINGSMENSKINSAYPFTADVLTVPSIFSRPAFFQYGGVSDKKNDPKHPKGGQGQVEGFSTAIKEQGEAYQPYEATYEAPYSPIGVNTKMNNNRSSSSLNNQFAQREAAREAEEFRDKYCSAGQLSYKNVPVRTEMAGHIFPHLSFQDGQICNPCDQTCVIAVSDKARLLDTERRLKHGEIEERNMRKVSQDWVPTWFDIFLPHPVFRI